MKQKSLIFSILILFIIANTQYFWESIFGVSAFVIFVFLIIIFFVLVILVVRQIFLAVIEKGSDIKRIYTIAISSIILLLLYQFPEGIINFQKFESNELIVASREGAANCTTTLRLKENKEFVERSVCFGIDKITGNYFIKNDTIFFENVDFDSYYKFAVIKNSELVRYKNFNDTIPRSLDIVKNELKKQPAYNSRHD